MRASSVFRPAVAALLTALASAAAPRSGPAAAESLRALAGSEWGWPGAPKIYLQFRGGRVHGFAGCNRFTGRYAFEAGYLTLGPLAVTRKACAPAVMADERRVLDIFAATRRAEATHLVLTLIDGDGHTLAALQRRDWD